MGVLLSDSILDLPLTGIALGDRVSYLSAEPASIADITTTYKLGSKAITPGDGNGFTIANGDASGRKVTVGAVTDVPISSNGTITHVAVDNGTHFAVTTCPGTAVTASTSRNMAAFDIEFPDATAEA